MKSLRNIFIMSAMLVGIVNADCCIVDCCQPTQCVKQVVKYVPYQAWKVVCIPVTDGCGNVLYYKQVKRCYTAYKKVVVNQIVSCCN